MHTSEIELTRFADFQPTHFDARGLGSDGQADWLVAPVSRQPKISTLLDDSNWDAQLECIRKASDRVQRARRHVAHKLSRLLAIATILADAPFLGVSLEPFAHDVASNSPPSERLARLLRVVDLQPVDGETIAAFAERLDAAIEAGPDYEVHYFGHWASDFEVVVVRPGSAAHREAQSIAAALSDYPVLDDSDFSEREHEMSLENLEETIRHVEPYTTEAEEWDTAALASEVFGWLWDNEQHECECHDGGGAYPSRESVERALVALGYLEFEGQS